MHVALKDIHDGIVLSCRYVKLRPSNGQTVPGVFLCRTTKMSSLSIKFAVTVVDRNHSGNSVLRGEAGNSLRNFILIPQWYRISVKLLSAILGLMLEEYLCTNAGILVLLHEPKSLWRSFLCKT